MTVGTRKRVQEAPRRDAAAQPAPATVSEGPDTPLPEDIASLSPSAPASPPATRRAPAAPAKPAKPLRFSEKSLQGTIVDLIERKQTDRATKMLIDMLPLIHQSNINIKEKLSNLLFLAKAIQEGGGAKYGHVKLRSKIRTLATFLKDIELPQGGFVELGCGAHDPAALATYFYLNGLTPAYGVDLLKPRTDVFSALSMYDILAHIKMFPGRYTWGGRRPSEIIQNLRNIATARFEAGDFAGGMDSIASEVRLLVQNLLVCDIEPGSIALLTSFAMLEHVDDINAIMKRCFELMVPGGIAFHFNDLADHRSYRGDNLYGPLSFLTEVEAPANMNRLRAVQITRAARNAGFELLADQRIAAEVTPELRQKLIPQFAKMPIEDVAVIKQNLVLRKPVRDPS